MDKLKFDEIFFGDFHIHSRYSRACSTNINFENLVKWAKIKGINLLGTGDFTHPLWLKEIKEKLKEENGFYYYNDFPFIIQPTILDDKGEASVRLRPIADDWLAPDVLNPHRIRVLFRTKLMP